MDSLSVNLARCAKSEPRPCERALSFWDLTRGCTFWRPLSTAQSSQHFLPKAWQQTQCSSLSSIQVQMPEPHGERIGSKRLGTRQGRKGICCQPSSSQRLHRHGKNIRCARNASHLTCTIDTTGVNHRHPDYILCSFWYLLHRAAGLSNSSFAQSA